MTNILQNIGKVNFPGIQKFIASENFVIDVSGNNTIKISYIGKNFPIWFFSKVESNLPPSTLTYCSLMKNANDTEILSDIGREEKVEIFLAEMFYLISLQPCGEEGVLLQSGAVNFFYVRDISCVLRTIRLLWQDDGWGIHAILPHDVLNLPMWNKSSQVFSRN